jgi:thiol-disulfide isomerase/thioredoxin
MEPKESEIIIQSSITGINNVRNPSLEFIQLSETKDYTEYQIMTNKDRQKIKDENPDCPQPYTNTIKSFIYCNESLKIKKPKQSYMIKNGKKRFAYAVGMFPNPKTGKASYLDGCILAALGLKRQKTMADVVCFITHDISKEDKQKLEVVFDKVMYVPYISPYDMGGEGKLKTIMMDPELFKNCPNYTKNHPYVHVFFKLHIFNPELFPYEKVCFVDSDLVPLNYYDSLFLLDCPAGFVEYRKKIPYLESFHWDRCDYLQHGENIPKEITDIDKKTGADVNAGLLLVKPNQTEYDSMIKELSSPLKSWMGPNKLHKGFHSFNFDNPDGREFVKNSYCFPEQNYLTKRYSGTWKYIEFAFQSWALDPCNSFGIHMAAFNPKPWFKQPIAGKLQIKETYNPYIKQRSKKNIRIPITIKEDSKQNYDNISFSYEIFNELIIWGLYNYKELCGFFVHGTQIHGTKVSFDRDVFEKISPNESFKLLKNIKKSSKLYKKLSLTQQYISDLLNKDKDIRTTLKKGFLQICRSNKIDKEGNTNKDYTIIDYPDHKVRKKVHQLGGSKKRTAKQSKRKSKKRKSKKRKSKKRTHRKRKSTISFLFFSMKGCHYCELMKPTWKQLKKKHKQSPINFIEYERFSNPKIIQEYNIQSFPTLMKIKSTHAKPILYKGDRSLQSFEKFLKL